MKKKAMRRRIQETEETIERLDKVIDTLLDSPSNMAVEFIRISRELEKELQKRITDTYTSSNAFFKPIDFKGTPV